LENDEAIELMHWTFPWLGELHFGPFAVDWFYNDAFTKAWNGLPPPPYPKDMFAHLFHRMAVLGLFSFWRDDHVSKVSESTTLSYQELLDAVSGVTSGPNRDADIVAEMTELGYDVYRQCLEARPYFKADLKRAARTIFARQ
jgi:hypothetical protein